MSTTERRPPPTTPSPRGPMRTYTVDAFPVTLNAERVNKLPVYKLPPTYRLGTPGMGCAGDAPGYPTYYIRPVYNQHGNTPRNAPDAVLLGTDGQLHRIDFYDPKTGKE